MFQSLVSIRRGVLAGLVAVVCVVLNGPVRGQESPGTTAAGQPAAKQASDTGHSDRLVLAMLHHLFTEEAEISRFAVDKVQRPEVKDFAQTMAQEYQGFLDQLHQTFPESGQPSHEQNAATDPISLFHDIAKRHVQLVERHLDQYQGQRVDSAYAGHEVGDHLKIIAQLQGLQNHASSQLRQLIDQSLAKAEHNLQQANQLSDRLNDISVRAAERPVETTPQR